VNNEPLHFLGADGVTMVDRGGCHVGADGATYYLGRWDQFHDPWWRKILHKIVGYLIGAFFTILGVAFWVCYLYWFAAVDPQLKRDVCGEFGQKCAVQYSTDFFGDVIKSLGLR